jgi:hypothetical protein
VEIARCRQPAIHLGVTCHGARQRDGRDEMGFVQIIEYRTDRFEEMQAIGEEWEKATEGKRKTRKRVIARDRENPGRYFIIVFFDSFEDAMSNSELPETDALSRKMMGLGTGAPTFYNLDVVDERD